MSQKKKLSAVFIRTKKRIISDVIKLRNDVDIYDRAWTRVYVVI